MLNTKELGVLKACATNALDAAGGDFGFTDEVPAYVPELSANQVKGYLSDLQTKGLISIDTNVVDGEKISQLTLEREALVTLVEANMADTEFVEQFDCWYWAVIR